MKKSDQGSDLGIVQTSDGLIRNLLNQKLTDIERAFGDAHTNVNAMSFVGPLTDRAELLVRGALESITERKPGLLVILETGGGYIETVERVVEILRHFYKKVFFLIPDYAMSAGTVLAMSGDSILMDYFSVLGPIDPQVQRPGSQSRIPVQGYLAQYEKLLKKAAAGTINTAELHILTGRFDQAEIYKFEQAVELSVTLLKKWLVQYKFKDWKKTESSNNNVTKKMKEQRAEEIARALNDVSRWHTHERGISMKVLQEDLKLKIDDFGANDTLRRSVQAYDILLKDYMLRTSQHAVVHAQGFYISFGG